MRMTQRRKLINDKLNQKRKTIDAFFNNRDIENMIGMKLGENDLIELEANDFIERHHAVGGFWRSRRKEKRV